MNKDVILLNKIRGLKMEVGESINYDPNTGMYVYESIKEEQKDNYSKTDKVSYTFPPNYIKFLCNRKVAEDVGTCELDGAESRECEEKKEVSLTSISEDIDRLYNYFIERGNTIRRLYNPWRFWFI
jgi:hypothetical protein